jgi:hypothetical protein
MNIFPNNSSNQKTQGNIDTQNAQQAGKVNSGKGKGDWKGIIATNKGFIRINSKGEVIKTNGQVKTVLPPGMRIDYLKGFTGYSNNGEDIFKNSLQVLDDGRVAFIGSFNVSTALKENTVYTWQINSQENPRPLFTTEENQKIVRFTISPDKSEIAVISLTLDEEDQYGLTKNTKDLSKDDINKFYEKRKKQLEEYGVVSIYTLKDKQLVRKLKIESGDEYDRLAWKGDYLYIFNSFQWWVYEVKTNQLVYQSPKYSGGPIGDNVVISPNGTKFIHVPEQLIKVLPSKENLINFESYTVVEYNAFSSDSKKMLVQKPKTVDGPIIGDTDKIGEVSLDNGKISVVGAFETLIDLPGILSNRMDLQKNSSYSPQRFNLPFIVYNPSGDYVIFAVAGSGNKDVLVDLFGLKIGESKAKGNNLTGFDLSTLRDIAFLGWYQSAD